MYQNSENTELTIVIPTYNRATKLDKTLASYTANSSRKIIFQISDNGSNDDTQLVIRKWCEADERIRSVRNRQNIGYNRNVFRGLNEVETRFVMLLSDDDRITKGYIDKVLSLISKHPDIAFIYDIKMWKQHGEKDYKKPSSKNREQYYFHAGAEAFTFLFDKSGAMSGMTFNLQKLDLHEWLLGATHANPIFVD